MTKSSPDPDTLVYVADLVRLEMAGERAPLAVGPYTAFTLVSAIQFATRHPDIGADLTRLLTELANKIIRGYFGGTPGEALLLAGWDRSQDVPFDAAPDPPDALGRTAYAAYGAFTDGLNHRGEPLPKWDALPLKIQHAWLAASVTVFKFAGS